ncbi:MAG: sugar phosphate isomerase/epimerase [Kiritimatiellae bacterium]|nr:sugar phosphate isomerase/epimerase [Kiritimatiellia bacterium]
MNRREFLAGTFAATGLAGCLGPTFSKSMEVPARSGGGILFGACRSSVEDVAVMRDLGYDFWEWSAGEAFNPGKDDAWWQGQKEEIAKRPLPLRSCNGFLPGKFRLTGPNADHAPALDYAETVLRRADEVGVKTIVFGSGGARNVPGDFTTQGHPDLERGTRQYAEFCHALVKRVADLKTTKVVIEPLRPNESNIINYVFQGLAICREVGSPRLAQLADIFHMMMGGDPASAIVEAGSLLAHCHIADYKTRQFPGFDPKETSRLAPYFAALKAIGYAGGVSCECGWGDKKDFAKNAKTAIETMKGLI